MGGEQHFFDAIEIQDARNATWRMNPVPRNDTFQTGESFAPLCDEVPGCNAQQWTNETQTAQDSTCRCSGICECFCNAAITVWQRRMVSHTVLHIYDHACVVDCAGGPYNMEIVDMVLIPPDLEPGDWVLGWRYDCEESSQVWSSCSDVRVV